MCILINLCVALVESFVLLPHDHKREKSCPPCILIQTPLRGLKVECIDMSSHDAWIKVFF